MSDDRRIEYVSLRKLRADPRNPKAHSEETIGSSVTRFGFVEPIVIDERTGFIASGHGRVSTLTKMRVDGLPAPDGIRVTAKGDWLAPVVRGWRTDNDYEAGAALIAFNRAGEVGGWADESLLALLHELEDEGDDLGFTPDDIEHLERSVEKATGRPAKDPVAQLRKEGRASPGETWELGGHRLVVGDDDPLYADLLLERWERATGKRARCCAPDEERS